MFLHMTLLQDALMQEEKSDFLSEAYGVSNSVNLSGGARVQEEDIEYTVKPINPHLFTKETAPEKGRIGGLASAAQRKRRAEDPQKWVQDTLKRAQPELVEALLEAAGAKGTWSQLSPEKRLSAVIKALEYALGRPISFEPKPEPGEHQAVGLTIS